MISKARALFLLTMLCIYTPDILAQSSMRYADLSTGNWYKIAIPASGAYKLDQSFLTSLGIDTENLDPRNLRAFGYGGGMLPQPNDATRPEGLPEIPLGGEGIFDGSMSPADFYILFARGPDKSVYDAASGEWIYEKNLYADSTYIFLTVGDIHGLRVQEGISISGTHTIIDQYEDFQVHERDEINQLNSGRHWFGNRMSTLGNSTQLPPFEVSGIIPGSEIILKTRVANFATSPAAFTLTIDGREITRLNAGRVTSDTYGTKVTTSSATAYLTAGNSESLRPAFTYEAGSDPAAIGAVDYLSITCQRKLTMEGNQLIWLSPSSQSHSSVTYQIENVPARIRIWNISRDDSIIQIPVSVRNTVGSFSQNVPFDGPSQYIAFDETSLNTPVAIRAVANQGLRSLSAPDLLIVTHPTLRTEAERLASFRRSHDGLNVTVVTTPQIYNEFSSGRQDITAIRDFVKHLYDTQPGKLAYLLLFGHASYDYKNRVTDNLNLVPTYQSRNSHHSVLTYSSDDYFGFLEDTEGEWEESSVANDHTLELGIGRIPAKDAEEASDLVDKLIHYATAPSSLGPWRNRLLFVADDGDGNTHQRDANRLTELLDTTSKNYNIKKLYLDSYRQLVRADRETSPAARKALNDAVKNGQFIVNYSGHGGPAGWTRETILDQNMITAWDNLDKLPIFVTATCEFGLHDDPARISGGERLLLNPDGGAIGLVTTTRPVYSYTNYLLNREFYRHVFNKDDEGPQRLGDIFKETKNSSINGVNNRNFTLLGDPSMMPAFPKSNVIVDEIKSDNPETGADTLQAMGRIRVKGRVVSESGNTDTNFDGHVEVTLFDKPQEKKTYGTENTSAFLYKEQDNVLFRGTATLVNGEFTIEIPAPRNLDYTYGNGKISFYALHGNGINDARGVKSDVVVGGTDCRATVEQTPPEIKLYLNDTTFSPGGVISPAVTLLARLSDESGINVSRSAIGQDIKLIIDEEDAIVLNDFYIADVDDFTSGTIAYPLSYLAPGEHTMRLEAWDNLNNKGGSSLVFKVSEGEELMIYEAGNYPNPISSQTVFSFRHNKPGSDLTVTIEIMDIHGRTIGTLINDFPASSSQIETEAWEAIDMSGNTLMPGLYIYRMTVEDDQGFKKAVVKRLVCSK
ncbi:type IX secretion system sortase PorU [Roseivirga sp. BDSF3-8]|uniref:type IX secretion system sortase PorU n=1 Tax=Roseivirga sp. BDSF3-8 TaxID=3241598 RepID=UPI00353185E4